MTTSPQTAALCRHRSALVTWMTDFRGKIGYSCSAPNLDKSSWLFLLKCKSLAFWIVWYHSINLVITRSKSWLSGGNEEALPSIINKRFVFRLIKESERDVFNIPFPGFWRVQAKSFWPGIASPTFTTPSILSRPIPSALSTPDTDREEEGGEPGELDKLRKTIQEHLLFDSFDTIHILINGKVLTIAYGLRLVFIDIGTFSWDYHILQTTIFVHCVAHFTPVTSAHQ